MAMLKNVIYQVAHLKYQRTNRHDYTFEIVANLINTELYNHPDDIIKEKTD